MHRLTDISLRNRTIAVLGMLLVLVFGIISTTSIKQELLPAMEMPQSVIVAPYPGAAPETVEREVTKPLEDAVKGISGVTKVKSSTQSSVAMINVTWEAGQESQNISNSVRSAIDKTRSSLPKDVNPEMMAGSTSDIPAVVLSILGAEGEDIGQLAERLNQTLLPKLKAVPGVRDAIITGIPQRVVNITLNLDEMTKRGVDPSTVPMLFKSESMALPGGTLTGKTRSLDVLVGRSMTSVNDVMSLSLPSEDGPVRLGDVAKISLDPAKQVLYERTNGKNAVTLLVMKLPDGNAIEVSHQTSKLLKEAGGNLETAVLFDQAPWIEQSVHDLAAEGGLGLLFAILVIMVFLWSLRPTLISAISIPLSLLIALIALWSTDNTLNLLTLGALTTAIGRVVDDSIVVIENIQRHQSLGRRGSDLIMTSVREVSSAITSSTLTAVAVFLPLAFVGGQAGEMFRPFALTVTVALLGSLVVALTVVPVLAAFFLKPAAETHVTNAAHQPETRLQRSYLPALRWSLRHIIVTLLLATLVFVGTMAFTPLLKTDFIGNAGQATLSITQTMPSGTGLDETNKAAKLVEAVLGADDDVETYMTTIGGRAMRNTMTPDPAMASYMVTLKAGATAAAAGERIRTQLDTLSNIGEVSVVDSGTSLDIELLITGPTDEALAAGNQAVLAALKPVTEVTSIRSNLNTTKEQLALSLKGRATKVGISQGQLSQYVMMATNGVPLGQIQIEDKSTDVKLWLTKPTRSAEALLKLKLPVTMQQTMEVRKQAGEKVQEAQEAAANAAKAKATRELASQERAMRDGRAQSQRALSALQRQLAELLKLPPDTELPEPPALQKQIAQLRGQIASIKAGLSQADAGLRKLSQSRAEAAAGQAQGERLAQMAKDAAKAKATPLELGEIADIKTVEAPATITRQDGARTVIVSVQPATEDLGAASQAVTKAMAELTLPQGVDVKIAGVAQEQGEAFSQLGLAMLAAVGIVYLIMVATFKSLIQPLILLVSIPFAATGALGLSLITGTPIGLPSMIGLLMLIGIVVTNAIVLIDLINQFRANGDSVADATIHGARLRLRPIIMTALATICAMLPMGFGLTGGGLFISKPLAIVVIGGLISSTVLTLILVPVLYDIVENLRDRIQRRTKNKKGESPALAQTADYAE